MMGIFDDLTGKRFGRLSVVERAPDYVSPKHQHATRWVCACDCGNTKIIIANVLKRGEAQSCGCMHQELRHSLTRTHGESKTRLYHIWNGMRQRCQNENNHAFAHYGGRGISVCEEWQSYTAFREWSLANGYTDELSIDRIDNDKGYCPKNCRWVSQTVQANNQSKNVYLTFRGITKTRSQWAKEIGVSDALLRDRIDRYGWTIERALTTPVRR